MNHILTKLFLQKKKKIHECPHLISLYQAVDWQVGHPCLKTRAIKVLSSPSWGGRGTKNRVLLGRQVRAELLSWSMLNKNKHGPGNPARQRAGDQTSWAWEIYGGQYSRGHFPSVSHRDRWPQTCSWNNYCWREEAGLVGAAQPAEQEPQDLIGWKIWTREASALPTHPISDPKQTLSSLLPSCVCVFSSPSNNLDCFLLISLSYLFLEKN